MAHGEFKSFAEFWTFYVAEHSQAKTRLWHAVGTMTSLMLFVVWLISGDWWWLPLVFAPGYGAAWIGHFFIEHNRPASFRYPFWSFLADYKMIALMLAGRMDEEVKRAQKQRSRRMARSQA